jgi:uncharacterized protein YndB with AHSA1/START domain
MSAATAKTQTAASPDFVISRVFDAPRDLMWKAVTEPQRIKEWWGPKGTKVIVANMDLRPGGTYHYGMQTPDGARMFGKLTYREIAPPQRLVFITAFSDEAGGITRHPMAPTWPLEMLSTFTFEEQPDGKTRFTIRWSPLNPTADEQKTFDTSHDNMRQGWGGSLDELATYLATAKA